MVVQVEQEGRRCMVTQVEQRAEDDGTGGAGGQRMAAQVEQGGRGCWHGRNRGGIRVQIKSI